MEWHTALTTKLLACNDVSSSSPKNYVKHGLWSQVSRKSVTCKSDENENFLTNVILELLFPIVLLYCSSLREETDLLHI